MGKNNNAQSNTEHQADLPVENNSATENKPVEATENKPTATDTKPTGFIKIKARTITKKGHYYRAGLSFIVSHKEYEVSDEVLKVLKADKWLEVEVLK